MDPDVLARMGPGALLVGGLLYGVLSATIPLFNTELFVVAASMVSAKSLRLPLVLAVTVGTMLGKVALYEGADHLVARMTPARRAKLERATASLQRHPALTWPTVFASGLVGLPPLYLVTVACGALRLGLATYVVVTGVGRLVRFGALVYAPDLWREMHVAQLLRGVLA